MNRNQKIGYCLFGLAFVSPSFDFTHWGIQIATDCVLSGVSLLISGFPEMIIGVVMLSLFFVNFTVIPGSEIKKGIRITSMILAGLAGVIPQEGINGEMMFFITTPPYLLWATSIILLNLTMMKKVEPGS